MFTPKSSMIQDINKTVPPYIYFLFFSTVSFIWIMVLLQKYYHLGYYDWDFAFFAQVMHQLTKGSLYSSIFDTTFLANHSNLISYCILPLYHIFHTPKFLLVLKALSLGATSTLILKFAVEKLGFKAGLIIAIIYVLYPPNIYGMLYEFDFESLGLFFIIWLFYSIEHRKIWQGLVAAVLLALTKENMCLMVSTLGMYGFVFKKQERGWWGIIALGAIASFVYLTFVFIPQMADQPIGQHPYLYQYQSLGTAVSGKDGLLQYISYLTSDPVRHKWFLSLLLSVFFLPLLSINFYLALPLLLQHFLSNQMMQHTIYYGYSMALGIFIFLGLIDVLHRWDKVKGRALVKVYLLILLMIGIAYPLNEYKNIKLRFLSSSVDQNNISQYWQMIDQIPADACVVATFDFLGPLSQRSCLYAFHKFYHPSFINYPWPAKVDFALINFKDEWLDCRGSCDQQYINKHVDDFFDRYHFTLIKQVDKTYLLKREE